MTVWIRMQAGWEPMRKGGSGIASQTIYSLIDLLPIRLKFQLCVTKHHGHACSELIETMAHDRSQLLKERDWSSQIGGCIPCQASASGPLLQTEPKCSNSLFHGTLQTYIANEMTCPSYCTCYAVWTGLIEHFDRYPSIRARETDTC